MKVSVIGAGLAGCEVAMQLANVGIEVDLYEQKPVSHSPAHKYNGYAELVCSNSLKASRLGSSAGLLKAEISMFGSLVLESAKQNSVPAGGALAVDRDKFSDYITEKINTHPKINVISKEVLEVPKEGYVVIATGPLTSDSLAKSISEVVDMQHLNFYDAAAPIVTAESIDMSIAFSASRYGRGDDDYINCPMTKEEYNLFYKELIQGESAPLKEIDKRDFRVYEGCMPIEVMAKRGEDTIRYGPLKPVGLTDPRTEKRPWAVVQLRCENAEKTMYNLVGFQTNLKFGEQKRIFSMIPSLANAEFVRYGVMHRNTFIDSPRLLDKYCRLRNNPNIYFAGQINGVEGYMESAASGVYVGYHLAQTILGEEAVELPNTTMLGALLKYISDPTVEKFQPMGSNMGILPPLQERIRDKKERYNQLAKRSIEVMESLLGKKYIDENND